MSFILDALRRAERERRGPVPTVDTIHAPPAPEPRRLPIWVVPTSAAVVALLAIGVAGRGYLWPDPETPDPVPSGAVAVVPAPGGSVLPAPPAGPALPGQETRPSAPPGSRPPPAPALVVPRQPVASAAPPGPVASSGRVAPPAATPPALALPGRPGVTEGGEATAGDDAQAVKPPIPAVPPASQETSSAPALASPPPSPRPPSPVEATRSALAPVSPAAAPAPVAPAASAAAPAPAASRSTPSADVPPVARAVPSPPVVLSPTSPDAAREAPSSSGAAPAAAPSSGDPALSLDVLVYSEDDARRFVFINGRKYVEGDHLESGALVQRITRDGAVLRHDGRTIVLRPRLNPYLRP